MRSLQTTAESASRARQIPSELLTEMAGRRWFAQGAGWVVLAAFLAWFVLLFADNEHIDTAAVGQYFFNPRILKGLGSTFLLAVCAMVGALVGTIVGLGRTGPWQGFVRDPHTSSPPG